MTVSDATHQAWNPAAPALVVVACALDEHHARLPVQPPGLEATRRLLVSRASPPRKRNLPTMATYLGLRTRDA